jgi:hypothetical protein
MKLFELPSRQKERPRIWGLSPDGDPDGWVEFDHIDGMYSYCVAYAGDGTKLGVCHLSAMTPLRAVEDGWEIDDVD